MDKASIEHDGRRIEYTVIRSRRRKKTIEITLDPQDGVIVRSPARTPIRDLAELVQKRAAWILSRATEDILHPKPRRYTDGETLLYLGNQVPIVTSATTARRFTVNLQDGVFRIAVPDDLSVDQRPEKSRVALERWYRQEAKRLLPDLVARWQGRVGRKKPSFVQVRSQRRRWGSCSSDGSIRLNWRIIMAEPALIDYVVVHELVHLRHRGHGPDYWQALGRVMPDYERRREDLRQRGVGLAW